VLAGVYSCLINKARPLKLTVEPPNRKDVLLIIVWNTVEITDKARILTYNNRFENILNYGESRQIAGMPKTIDTGPFNVIRNPVWHPTKRRRRIIPDDFHKDLSYSAPDPAV
jgi:hypothetical protein